MQSEQAVTWRGRTAVDAEGNKIGTVEEVYLDADTDRPEWLAIKTGMFGSRISFVPVAEATDADGDVRVPYAKDQVKDAPHAEADGQLSEQEEARLYRHYGLDYSESRSDSGLPEGTNGDRTRQSPAGVVGNDVSGPETDHAMTRSEEELRVGTAERETGRVRLKKYVVEDEVTQTVPVRREQVRIEREPITDANVANATDGPAISEEEHEVTLHAEEAVAEKRTVPKERIRLEKDVETDQRQVNETVRKEQIDITDANGQPAQGTDGVRGTDPGVAR